MHNPSIESTWFLFEADAGDIEFLTSANIDFEIEAPSAPEIIPIDITGQQRMYVTGRKGSFIISTYNEKNVTLILLRFGNRLTMIHKQHSFSNGLL